MYVLCLYDYCTAAKVRLNSYCSAGDECADINAVCRNGVCICQLGYYDNGRDTCRMYYSHFYKLLLLP